MELTTHLSYHGAFLWSLEKHLPDVVPMIFHHGEVAWTSVYKFHDWSMGREGSLLTTDYTFTLEILIRSTGTIDLQAGIYRRLFLSKVKALTLCIS